LARSANTERARRDAETKVNAAMAFCIWKALCASAAQGTCEAVPRQMLAREKDGEIIDLPNPLPPRRDMD
jgi:hypothetical protein